jgi:hypothetical protein
VQALRVDGESRTRTGDTTIFRESRFGGIAHEKTCTSACSPSRCSAPMRSVSIGLVCVWDCAGALEVPMELRRIPERSCWPSPPRAHEAQRGAPPDTNSPPWSASPFGPLFARLRAHETTVARRRPLTTGRCTCWCGASPARTSPGGELASTDALGECETPGVDDPDGRRANAQTRRAASVPSGLLHGGQRDEDDDAQPRRRYP